MLTTVKTPSSSSAVVPPSALICPTKVIRPTASAVVNRIATHGVRRPGSTRPSTGGSTRWWAIPYSRRLAISMLINAVFATANMLISGKTSPIGQFGAPALTTLSSGASPWPSSPAGTSAIAVIDTRM